MALSISKINDFIVLLDDICNDNTPWQDKRNAIRAACGENDLMNIHEFCEWFYEDEDEDESDDDSGEKEPA